jgi:hypothetical protein
MGFGLEIGKSSYKEIDNWEVSKKITERKKTTLVNALFARYLSLQLKRKSRNYF